MLSTVFTDGCQFSSGMMKATRFVSYTSRTVQCTQNVEKYLYICLERDNKRERKTVRCSHLSMAVKLQTFKRNMVVAQLFL